MKIPASEIIDSVIKILSDVHGEPVAHDPRTGACYIVRTGEWCQSKCPDPECVFCSNRPERYTP